MTEYDKSGARTKSGRKKRKQATRENVLVVYNGPSIGFINTVMDKHPELEYDLYCGTNRH